jgi:hypothetical protein
VSYPATKQTQKWNKSILKMCPIAIQPSLAPVVLVQLVAVQTKQPIGEIAYSLSGTLLPGLINEREAVPP